MKHPSRLRYAVRFGVVPFGWSVFIDGIGHWTRFQGVTSAEQHVCELLKSVVSLGLVPP